MNLKFDSDKSYAPLLIIVAVVVVLIDHTVSGGTTWWSYGAGIAALLSMLYLLGRAIQNWVRDVQADRQRRLDQLQAEREARTRLQRTIRGNHGAE